MFKKLILVLLALLPMVAFAAYQTGAVAEVQAAFSGIAVERLSPFERVSWDQINIFQDRVEIDVNDVVAVAIADTNSMDPVIDKESKVLEIVPNSPADIHLGDVISYKTDRGYIIHRVIETGEDEKGWFAITKGDNVLDSDGKVRWDQVKRVVIGIIY